MLLFLNTLPSFWKVLVGLCRETIPGEIKPFLNLLLEVTLILTNETQMTVLMADTERKERRKKQPLRIRRQNFWLLKSVSQRCSWASEFMSYRNLTNRRRRM